MYAEKVASRYAPPPPPQQSSVGVITPTALLASME